MIDVSVAIDKARELFGTVYKDLADAQEIVDLLIEEVELSEDEGFWTVTLGFSRKGEVNPTTVGEALAQISPKLVRTYKTIRIDAETGRVHSMKTRAPKAS